MSAALAGACGGLLAYGIGFMDGVAGQRGWRWILILEGLPTFVLGIATWFLLADDPESAYYLSNVSDFHTIILLPSILQSVSHSGRGPTIPGVVMLNPSFVNALPLNCVRLRLKKCNT